MNRWDDEIFSDRPIKKYFTESKTLHRASNFDFDLEISIQTSVFRFGYQILISQSIFRRNKSKFLFRLLIGF
jgi:hypothetical protein